MSKITINGVETRVPEGAIAYKYADPTEAARWVYEQSDLDEIRSADPSLIEMAYPVAVAREVEARRPDLSVGDAISTVLTADPALTADEVIEILDQATADHAADMAHDAR